MALMKCCKKCSECAKEKSDKIRICPNYSYKTKINKKNLLYCILGLFVFIILLHFCAQFWINSNKVTKMHKKLIGKTFTNANYEAIEEDSLKYGSRVSKSRYIFKTDSEVAYFYDYYILPGYTNAYVTDGNEISTQHTYKYEITKNEIIIYKNNEKEIFKYDENKDCIYNEKYNNTLYYN